VDSGRQAGASLKYDQFWLSGMLALWQRALRQRAMREQTPRGQQIEQSLLLTLTSKYDSAFY